MCAADRAHGRVAYAHRARSFAKGRGSAMANRPLIRIFRRRPQIDEAELEELQSRVLARLRGFGPKAEAQQAVETTISGAAATGEAIDPVATVGRDAPPVATYLLPANAAGLMTEPRRSEALPTGTGTADLELLIQTPKDESVRATRIAKPTVAKPVRPSTPKQRRLADAARWRREQQRWLKAAAALDAPAEAIGRLEAAPITEEVAGASRTVYITAVERAFHVANRERRWGDASLIMRNHAMVLFRLAGSPMPPPEEIVQPHREGAAAALRGIAAIAREAELLSGRCCLACQADDGRTFLIANELRAPRLPHRGCPKGLCRCDWFFTTRDASLVRRHLRRRANAVAALPPRRV
jgi:hypothetical protein